MTLALLCNILNQTKKTRFFFALLLLFLGLVTSRLSLLPYLIFEGAVMQTTKRSAKRGSWIIWRRNQEWFLFIGAYRMLSDSRRKKKKTIVTRGYWEIDDPCKYVRNYYEEIIGGLQRWREILNLIMYKQKKFEKVFFLFCARIINNKIIIS